MKKNLFLGLMLLGATCAFGADQSNALNADLSFSIDDYKTTSGTIKISDNSIGSTKNGAYVIYSFTSPSTSAYNVKATWGGKYDATITMNISSDAESFESEGVSKNLTGNGKDYTPIVTETWSKFELTKGQTYYLKVTFSSTESWAGDINYLALEEYDENVTRYTLTATAASGLGTITGNNDSEYDEGSQAILSANPNEGYRFKEWNINGSETSTDNPITLTMNANTTIEAVFEEIPDALQADLTFNLVDYYSTSGNIAIDNSGIESTKNNDTVIYKFSVPATGKYGIVANWASKYDTTLSMNVSESSSAFVDAEAVSINLKSTDSYSNYIYNDWGTRELTAGTVYYLQVKYTTSAGWAGNTNYIALKKVWYNVTDDNSNLEANDIYNETANSIALNDNIDYYLPFDVTAKAASYTRTVTADSWNALYLPFAVTNASDFASKVVEFTDIEEDGSTVNLVFKDVDLNTTLVAGKIYLFQPKSAGEISAQATKATVNAFLYGTESVKIATASATYTLTGTYAQTKGLKSMNAYALSDDAFHKAKTDDVTLNPYRAYLTVVAADPKQAPALIGIKTSEGTASMPVITSENSLEDNVYYNLQGIRVDNPTSGLYIHNGKKIYVK